MRISRTSAHRAEPQVVALFTSRARQTDIATATTNAATPPAPAMKPPATKNLVGIGVEREPLPEECGRQIDRQAQYREPWRTGPRLKGELPCGPLRCRPNEAEHRRANRENLKPENLGRVHGDRRSLERQLLCASADRLTKGARIRRDRNRSGTLMLEASGRRFPTEAFRG